MAAERTREAQEPLGADLVIPALALGLRGLLLRLDRRPRLGSEGERRADRRVLVVADRHPARAHRRCASRAGGATWVSTALLGAARGARQAHRPRAAHRRVHRRDARGWGSRSRSSSRCSPRCSSWACASALHLLSSAAGAAAAAYLHVLRRARLGFSARADRAPDRGALPARSVTWEFLLGQFATQFGLWWVIWPAILLGHRRRHPAGVQPAEHADHAAAADAGGAGRAGAGVHDRAVLREPPRRRHSCDPGEDPGLGRRRRDDARRLSDDAEGPGAAGAGAVLHRVGLRRAHHHARDARAAAVAVAARACTCARWRWSS